MAWQECLAMAKTVLDQARRKAILIALVVLRLKAIGKTILIAQTILAVRNGNAEEANP